MRLVNSDDDVLEDTSLVGNASFSDYQDYTSPQAPDSGRILTEFGLAVDIVNQSDNNEYGVVRLSKVSQHNITPTANFELNVNGLNVSANNFSSDQDGEITRYLWDFGNGATSNEMAPTWSYEQAG